MSLEILTVSVSSSYARKLGVHNKYPVSINSDGESYPGIVSINKKAKLEKSLVENGCIPNGLQGKKFSLDLACYWLFAKSIAFKLLKEEQKPTDYTLLDDALSPISTFSNASLSDVANVPNLCKFLQQELKKNTTITLKVGMKLCLRFLTQKFLLIVHGIVPSFYESLDAVPNVGFRYFEGTQVEIIDGDAIKMAEDGLSFEHFGGYEEVVKDLKENVDKLFVGKKSVSGILISGISGVGKSFLGKILQCLYKDKCIMIASEDILSSYKGEAELALKKLFSRAHARPPSLIFIDGIDEICSSRDISIKSVGIVNALLYLMDGVQHSRSGDVLVIATTAHPEKMDQALRRPGRLSHDIVLPIPSQSDRSAILKCILKEIPSLHVTKELISLIVSRTSGFVAADLIKLISEAFSYTNNEFPSIENFINALDVIKPSSLSNVTTQSYKISLDQVYGFHSVKSELRNIFKMNLKHHKLFFSSGISPPSRILMFGPTGCGKSLMVHGLANHFNLVVIPVNRSSVFGKYFGESEKNINSLFEKAQRSSPCILHLENFDGVAGRKQRGSEVSNDVEGRVINHLKVMLDGVLGFEDVFVIAETNRPDLLDKDVIRQGRFHRYIHISLPSLEDRRDIIQGTLKLDSSYDDPGHSSNHLLATLAARTQGYSVAEVLLLCKEIESFREGEGCSGELSHVDGASSGVVEEAFKSVLPGTSSKMAKKYDEFASVYCPK